MMGIVKQFRKAQSIFGTPKQVVSRDDLMDILDEQGAQNAFGELDVDDLKQISGYADSWGLFEIEMPETWNWGADPGVVNNNPVVTLGPDGGWEVLDGKHRIGAARERGETRILAWMPMDF
jgi:hypothetical protein